MGGCRRTTIWGGTGFMCVEQTAMNNLHHHLVFVSSALIFLSLRTMLGAVPMPPNPLPLKRAPCFVNTLS